MTRRTPMGQAFLNPWRPASELGFGQVPIVGLSQAKKRPESEEYCDPMVQDCASASPPSTAGMYGATLGQGAPAPAKKISVPVVITAATLGGAALGVILSFLVMPKITKTKMARGPKIAIGAVGGGIGGLVGAGITFALKD